jgi:hypothetical protein
MKSDRMKPGFMLPAFKNSQATSLFEEKSMNKLRKLFLALSLSVILSGIAFAGETSSPPCANPGETSSPPCSSGQFIIDEATEASSSVSGEVETTIIEAASYAVESLLSLFYQQLPGNSPLALKDSCVESWLKPGKVV